MGSEMCIRDSLQTLLDSPRALSSFAAQLSPRLAEMYGVDFGAFLFDES